MKAEIKRCHNGFVIKLRQEYDDGVKYFQNIVVEEKDGDEKHAEIKALIEAFHHLAQYFGCYHSKHSPHNLIMKCECEAPNAD